jgi:vacuolar protein sorting-associated protein 13A/C
MKLFDYYTINIQINRQEKDKEELLDVELPIPIKKLMKENENSVRQLINYLALSSLKLELTIRLDTKPIELQIPILIDRILEGVFSALGRVSNCPLKFKEQIIERVYMSWYDLSWKIINPYITQGIVQIYKILGSLDIIGNPVNLINNITEGVSEFVLEPGKGMKKRNIGLGIGGGIAKGIGGLVSGVVGGAFDSLQRISTTLLVSVQTIAGRERKDIIFEEENEPKNALSGLYQGITGFGSEIGRGVYNLFTQPCSNYSTNGMSGFCSGLCKGLLGFALCPVTAALKLVSSISAGIKNSCFGLSGRKRLKTERFRYPRIIVEGGEKLESYDENKAEAKELLFILNKEDTDNILYSEDFICANKGFDRKFSTVILTDKSIYVIYDTQKIIFEENLRNINYALVHFIDNKYIIFFKLFNFFLLIKRISKK